MLRRFFFVFLRHVFHHLFPFSLLSHFHLSPLLSSPLLSSPLLSSLLFSSSLLSLSLFRCLASVSVLVVFFFCFVLSLLLLLCCCCWLLLRWCVCVAVVCRFGAMFSLFLLIFFITQALAE